MTTIPKNHHRRIAGLKAELTGCRVYTLENQFLGKDCDPVYAWVALAARRHARLTYSEAKGTYTVHVHDNYWYELTAAQPPRFGSRAVGQHVRVTAGPHEGQSGNITAVPGRDRITVFLAASGATVTILQADAEPAARVTYRDKPAGSHDYDVVPGFSPVAWGDLRPAPASEGGS